MQARAKAKAPARTRRYPGSDSQLRSSDSQLTEPNTRCRLLMMDYLTPLGEPIAGNPKGVYPLRFSSLWDTPSGSSQWDNPLGLQQQVEYTKLPKAIAANGVSPEPTRQLDCPTSRVALQTREHVGLLVFQTKFFQTLQKTLFAQILSHHHQNQDPLVQSVFTQLNPIVLSPVRRQSHRWKWSWRWYASDPLWQIPPTLSFFKKSALIAYTRYLKAVLRRKMSLTKTIKITRSCKKELCRRFKYVQHGYLHRQRLAFHLKMLFLLRLPQHTLCLSMTGFSLL